MLHIYRAQMCKQPTVVAVYQQYLATTVDMAKCCQLWKTTDRHLLITLSAQLSVQRNGRYGVTASRGPSALFDTCFALSLEKFHVVLLIALLWNLIVAAVYTNLSFNFEKVSTVVTAYGLCTSTRMNYS